MNYEETGAIQGNKRKITNPNNSIFCRKEKLTQDRLQQAIINKQDKLNVKRLRVEDIQEWNSKYHPTQITGPPNSTLLPTSARQDKRQNQSQQGIDQHWANQKNLAMKYSKQMFCDHPELSYFTNTDFTTEEPPLPPTLAQSRQRNVS